MNSESNYDHDTSVDQDDDNINDLNADLTDEYTMNAESNSNSARPGAISFVNSKIGVYDDDYE